MLRECVEKRGKHRTQCSEGVGLGQPPLPIRAVTRIKSRPFMEEGNPAGGKLEQLRLPLVHQTIQPAQFLAVGGDGTDKESGWSEFVF